MTPRWEISFEVAAELQPDARDLGHAIREGILAAQRGGQHPDIELAGGPTIRYLGPRDLPSAPDPELVSYAGSVAPARARRCWTAPFVARRREPWMRWYDLPGLKRIGLSRLVLQRKFWHPRPKRIARLRALYWWLIRGYPAEICGRCGGPVHVVFHVPDHLWTEHSGFPGAERTPGGQAGNGVLCVRCFDDLYDGPGYLEWTCAVDQPGGMAEQLVEEMEDALAPAAAARIRRAYEYSRAHDSPLAARAEVVARTAFARDWEQLAHTTRVVDQLGADATDAERAVAWLHDVVEDTYVELDDLTDLDFPVEVVDAVALLSRDHGTDYVAYTERLCSADGEAGRLARVVKLADARENLARCEAAAGVPKWQRLAERRYRPLIEAAAARALLPTEPDLAAASPDQPGAPRSRAYYALLQSRARAAGIGGRSGGTRSRTRSRVPHRDLPAPRDRGASPAEPAVEVAAGGGDEPQSGAGHVPGASWSRDRCPLPLGKLPGNGEVRAAAPTRPSRSPRWIPRPRGRRVRRRPARAGRG